MPRERAEQYEQCSLASKKRASSRRTGNGVSIALRAYRSLQSETRGTRCIDSATHRGPGRVPCSEHFLGATPSALGLSGSHGAAADNRPAGRRQSQADIDEWATNASSLCARFCRGARFCQSRSLRRALSAVYLDHFGSSTRSSVRISPSTVRNDCTFTSNCSTCLLSNQ